MTPVFLVSPPPEHWDAGGGEDGNVRAAEAKKRGDVNPRRALLAWIRFINYLVYVFGAEVIVMPPPPKGSAIFDTCFTRDLFFFVPGLGIVMSKMKARDRLGEPAFAEAFLRYLGLKVYGTMESCMEGDSCFFLLPNDTAVIFGCGSRADKDAGEELRRLFRKPVLSVQLDRDCFHLDLAGTAYRSREPVVLFHRGSLAKRHKRWRPDDAWLSLEGLCRHDGTALIELSDEDAARAAANSRDIAGQLIAPPDVSETLWHELSVVRSYIRHQMALEELLENGGGFTGCLSNPLRAAMEFSNMHTIPAEYSWPFWARRAMAMVSRYPTSIGKKASSGK